MNCPESKNKNKIRIVQCSDQLRRSQGEAAAGLTKLKKVRYPLQMSEKCGTNPTVT
jgi:hypothetical protein